MFISVIGQVTTLLWPSKDKLRVHSKNLITMEPVAKVLRKARSNMFEGISGTTSNSSDIS